jgi:hypothetical protein
MDTIEVRLDSNDMFIRYTEATAGGRQVDLTEKKKFRY